ncbi:MAG TPA: GNAT family N-acetyltransferase [Clostridia bacterium]
MRFKVYDDINRFYQDTYDILMRHESQNMIMLGNLIMGREGLDKTGWRDPKNWLMATVSDDGGIKFIALMTPPHNITLCATDNVIDEKALDCLIDGLKDYDIPGVVTEKKLAEVFAKAYTKKKGLTYKLGMNQRIYELTKVNPEIKKFGVLRLVEEKDMSFFPYWLEAFNASRTYGSAQMPVPLDEKEYHYRIAQKKIYILEVDGQPVSMAGYARKMTNSVAIAFVYTPPYYRGRGYASSCVAQLSQMALDNGYSKCALYTDLANPTSNSIYQKIGYKPVCDSLMLNFE